MNFTVAYIYVDTICTENEMSPKDGCHELRIHSYVVTT